MNTLAALLLYHLTIETGMPHLEENLRYSTTQETRCLGRDELATAFPVLQHVSLKGCSLGQQRVEGEQISYVLTCDGGHGTTGNATWNLSDKRITGVLNVKLGGKNMTFYQRVTAVAVGQCPNP